MYSEGSTAVKQDNETAFQWFKKAADIIDAVSFSSIIAFINRIDELFYSTSRQTTFEIFM